MHACKPTAMIAPPPATVWTWEWFLVALVALFVLALVAIGIGFAISNAPGVKPPEPPRIRGPTGTESPRDVASLVARDRTVPVIWSFWHDATPGCLSPIVSLCLASWQRFHPGACVCMLSYATLPLFLDPGDLPHAFLDDGGAMAQHKSDIVRLALLAKYGGIWLDASLITFGNIFDEWHPWSQNVPYDIGGFSTPIGKPCGTANRPCVIENWFLAAPRNNAFVRAWRDELYRAATTFSTRHAYFKHLDEMGIVGLGESYFWMHNAFLMLKQTRWKGHVRIQSEPSDTPRNPFGIFGRSFSRGVSGLWRMGVQSEDSLSPQPKMVKLISGHRKLAELLWPFFNEHSMLGQLMKDLHPKKSH